MVEVQDGIAENDPTSSAKAVPITLKTVGGNERKTTGSYYTPTSLINALLDSALNPVLTIGRQLVEVLRRHQKLDGVAARLY